MHLLQSFKGLLHSWSLLDFQTFEVFQDSYPRPIVNHAFDFWLAEIYFTPAWKSSLTKTGPAGLVLLPLYIHQFITLVIFSYYDSSLAVFRCQRILNIFWMFFKYRREVRMHVGNYNMVVLS